MFVVDTKEKMSEGRWRVYAPGVKIKIKPISKRRMAELVREATVDRDAVENGRIVTKKETDKDLLDRLICLNAVEDWEGFVDPDGNPLSPTPDNINTVMENFNQVSMWVGFEAGTMAETIAREKGLRLKNSKTSHDSAETGPGE